jgi:hypothetical protein
MMVLRTLINQKHLSMPIERARGAVPITKKRVCVFGVVGFAHHAGIKG